MGTFDADTGALAERAQLNQRLAAHDLDAWIIDHLALRDDQRILDLGCGTGKQLFALAAKVDEATSLLGVDVSADAVEIVNRRAADEDRSNVRAVEGTLDDWQPFADAGPFDIVLSTYAIYYAADMEGLMAAIADFLRPGGQLLVCGPGAGTNDEITAIVNEVAGDTHAGLDPVSDFIGPDVLSRLEAHYDRVVTDRLDNCVRFESADELMSWWRNHNSFRPALQAAVRSRLDDVLASTGSLELTKNVLAVQCHARAV
jgi:SAM-dependent methyltransferase